METKTKLIIGGAIVIFIAMGIFVNLQVRMDDGGNNAGTEYVPPPEPVNQSEVQQENYALILEDNMTSLITLTVILTLTVIPFLWFLRNIGRRGF